MSDTSHHRTWFVVRLRCEGKLLRKYIRHALRPEADCAGFQVVGDLNDASPMPTGYASGVVNILRRTHHYKSLSIELESWPVRIDRNGTIRPDGWEEKTW